MRQRVFGSSGVPVSVIGQGTWHLEQGDRAEAIRALRRGLDLGLTHVDTAELYGSGAVEELLGEALLGRRDEVFLVSKVMPSNASRRGTIEACERSLERLRTDRLDCYLLHWPGSHPLEATVAAFEELVAGGKIRSWGVSNFDADELAQVARLSGTARAVACDQVLHHLEERAIEHAVMPRCAELGVALVGYSPFGSGSFPERDTGGGRVLQKVAKAHGATPRQVALAFLLATGDHVFTIPKAASVAHVEENAAASDLVLTAGDRAAIDEAFPRPRPRSGIPTL